jgi:hypothetical protein
MNLFKSLAVPGLLCPLLLGAQLKTASIADLIAKTQALRATADFRAAGRLVRVMESGARKVYQVSLRGKWFPDGLRIFCEVNDPAPSRVKMLLQIGAGGKALIHTGRPGERAPKELPFESWGEPILDADLSYEDMLENHLLWRNQTLIREEKYGARDCYVIKSEPGASDRSHYSSVTSWLDREVLYPVKVEKLIRTSREVKEFIYYGLRESRGTWSASQVEVRIQGRPNSTLLIFSRGSAKANLKAGDFLPELLVKHE